MTRSIDPAPPDAAEILTHFESLGGRRQGCEFGLVQRWAGIEPLGLMRWTELFLHELLAALDSDLAGIGSPENTTLLIADWSEPEYISRDTRFGMSMHTELHPDRVPRDEANRLVCQRLVFLADKLLADLRAAEKIFVFRESTCRLTSKAMLTLHRAVARHGGGSVLIATYADSANPSGSVRSIRPGAYVGYFEHFRISPSYEPLEDVHDVWLAICRQTLELEKSRREQAGRGAPVPV